MKNLLLISLIFLTISTYSQSFSLDASTYSYRLVSQLQGYSNDAPYQINHNYDDTHGVTWGYNIGVGYTTKEIKRFSIKSGVSFTSLKFQYQINSTSDGTLIWGHYGEMTSFNVVESPEYRNVQLVIPLNLKYNVFSTVNLGVGISNNFTIYENKNDGLWGSDNNKYLPHMHYSVSATILKHIEIEVGIDDELRNFSDVITKKTSFNDEISINTQRMYSIGISYILPVSIFKKKDLQEIHTEPVIIE